MPIFCARKTNAHRLNYSNRFPSNSSTKKCEPSLKNLHHSKCKNFLSMDENYSDSVFFSCTLTMVNPSIKMLCSNCSHLFVTNGIRHLFLKHLDENTLSSITNTKKSFIISSSVPLVVLVLQRKFMTIKISGNALFD